MYRIKTDIRQYKCDTKEKVEKLIRNWVIRPNDLIYQADQQRWSPIGEHPSFLALFAVLEAQERAEPDTVVTANPLGSQAHTHAEADRVEEEVTRIKERPALADSEPDEVEGSPEEPEEDIRLTDVMDSVLTPPAAPEGVEPPVKADEVTVMTERTFDLMKITDEVDTPEGDVEREPTVFVQDQDAEPTTSAVRPSARAEARSDGAPEVNPIEETLELGGTSSAVEEMAAASDTVNPLESSRPKLGRHNLPEDFFATNELSAPVDRDQLRDDLAALEAAREDESVDDAWEKVEDVVAAHDDSSVVDDQDEEPSSADDFDNEEDEWDEYDDLDPADIAAHLSNKHSDRVADVYNIPLPFRIEPTPEDLALGIKRSNRSAAVKDAMFPTPEEKAYKTAHLRTFNLTREPPKDRTLRLVATILVVFTLFVVAIIIFN